MNKLIEPVRGVVKRTVNSFAKALNSFTDGKLNPDSITITSFLMHIPIAVFIARGEFVLAGLMLIFFGLFDALDGALARLQKSSSNLGMFLDSMTDRLKEVILYVGIAYYFAYQDENILLIWVVAAVGLSVAISYANAWGEVVMTRAKLETKHQTNKSFRGGIMSFDVRMFLLIVGLLFGILPFSVMTIVVLGTLTLVDRVWLIARKIH